MSRFVQWFAMTELHRRGWPKQRGFLRRSTDIPAPLADACVSGGLQIAMGLGSGRPEIAVRLLSDIFEDNVVQAVDGFFEAGDSVGVPDTEQDLAPWAALWAQSSFSSYKREVNWEEIVSPFGARKIAIPTALAAYLGLMHPAAFDFAWAHEHERQSAKGRGAPYHSLSEFFSWCTDVVRGFESENPALRAAPQELLELPFIKRRLVNRPGFD